MQFASFAFTLFELIMLILVLSILTGNVFYAESKAYSNINKFPAVYGHTGLIKQRNGKVIERTGAMYSE